MVPRKIGIDITNLPFDYYGGVDSYCRGLINGLSKLDNNIQYQIYVNKKYFLNRKFKLNKNFKFYVIEQSFLKKIISKIYNKFFPYLSVPFFEFKYLIDYFFRNYLNSEFKKIVKQKSEILIVPNTYLSFYEPKLKTYLNIHDLQHLHYPENFSKHEYFMRKYQYYNSAKYCYKLISSSSFIKGDLLKNFKFLKKKKIDVISEGVNINNFKNNKIKLKNSRFFFLPAQLWKHKNHLLVIEAFNFLNKKLKLNVKLIFCGKKFKENEILFNYIKKNKINNVKYLGLVSFEKLSNLYKECYCVLCPAVYESSSLTLLEAIASNKPVVASNNKPNLEKKNYFKINIFKKNNYMSLVKVIKKIYTNEKLLKKQIKFNAKKIKAFDWSLIGQQYLRVISQK